VSDDTLGDIKVLKWPELPQTSDERTIDGLIDALLEAETAEQIIGCRNELLTAWMGWQARGAQQCPKDQSFTAATEYRRQIENDALERAALHFDEMNSYIDLSASTVVNAIRAMKG
jgi:hypothetical protein